MIVDMLLTSHVGWLCVMNETNIMLIAGVMFEACLL